MLEMLNIGEKGRLKDLSKINWLVRRRMLDLGFVKGAEIVIKGIMPFGGPVMLESQGQCIAIRRKEALQIEVERL